MGQIRDEAYFTFICHFNPLRSKGDGMKTEEEEVGGCTV